MKKEILIISLIGVLLIIIGLKMSFSSKIDVDKIINQKYVSVSKDSFAYMEFDEVDNDYFVKIKLKKYENENHSIVENNHGLSYPVILKGNTFINDDLNFKIKVEDDLLEFESSNEMLKTIFNGNYEVYSNEEKIFQLPKFDDGTFSGKYYNNDSNVSIVYEDDKYFINGTIGDYQFKNEEVTVLNEVSFINNQNNIYFEVNNGNLVVLSVEYENLAISFVDGGINETLIKQTSITYADMINLLNRDVLLKEDSYF